MTTTSAITSAGHNLASRLCKQGSRARTSDSRRQCPPVSPHGSCKQEGGGNSQTCSDQVLGTRPAAPKLQGRPKRDAEQCPADRDRQVTRKSQSMVGALHETAGGRGAIAAPALGITRYANNGHHRPESEGPARPSPEGAGKPCGSETDRRARERGRCTEKILRPARRAAFPLFAR